MGLANAPTGFIYGFITTAMGILLVSRGVSVDRIGSISFLAFSPTFWGWLLSPVLDVHFTKRTYAFLFSTLAALGLAVTVLSVANLTVFTVALTLSCLAVVLYSTSVQGWAPDIVGGSEVDTMSGWLNVANLGAAGVFGAVAVVLVRVLPLAVAAAGLALLVMAPTLLLLRFPSPPQPAGQLAANFTAMGRDLRRVAKEGRVWVGLLIFLSPVCFALTNLFSSLGKDFRASETAVTALNGPAVAVVCSLGCLLAIPLCRRFQRRSIYLLSGVGAAAATVFLGLLPHTVVIFAAGLLAYNFFQGFNYTALTALELEIIGPRNALAGTMIAVLSASSNIPISSMTKLDGWVHDTYGLRAMLFTDGAAALLAVAVLLPFVLPMIDRYMQRREKPVVN
jgi:PAT family beta-lactamase induction signal transducer AmpG